MCQISTIWSPVMSLSWNPFQSTLLNLPPPTNEKEISQMLLLRACIMVTKMDYSMVLYNKLSLPIPPNQCVHSPFNLGNINVFIHAVTFISMQEGLDF